MHQPTHHALHVPPLAAHACMSAASVVCMNLPICSLKFHSNGSAILHHVENDVTNIKLRGTIVPAQELLAVGSLA